MLSVYKRAEPIAALKKAGLDLAWQNAVKDASPPSDLRIVTASYQRPDGGWAVCTSFVFPSATDNWKVVPITPRGVADRHREYPTRTEAVVCAIKRAARLGAKPG